MLALERGCHVVAFDILTDNVNRVVQTAAEARGVDGRLFLERISVFQNGVKCVASRSAPCLTCPLFLRHVHTLAQ
jgi:hypothetical protein